jgi:Ca2+-binding RTX toxin-like protein
MFQTTENSSIVNHGIIGQADLAGTSETCAISIGEGNDRIVNDGRIYGHVMLGAGNDTIDTRGGTISGDIIGGVGSDTLITDKAGHMLTEDLADVVGIDTVKSTVSYTLNLGVENLILLGTRNNSATGSDFDNTLKGNTGNNKLTGLGGADTFQFGTHGGTDMITDFELGIDQIDLRSWKGIGDFNEVLDHARDKGGDVQIKVGADVLIIENTEKNDLSDTDFIFA